MVMPRVQIVQDTVLLEGFAGLGTRFPVFVRKRFRQLALPIRKRLLAKLRIKPGPVVYANKGKLRWKSRKQQKAFFASDGFGGGIPTIRTDSYIDSFDVTIVQTAYSGFMQAENDHPGAIYIGGPEQQPFHADTGWQLYTPVIEEERAATTELLADQLLFLKDPTLRGEV